MISSYSSAVQGIVSDLMLAYCREFNRVTEYYRVQGLYYTDPVEYYMYTGSTENYRAGSRITEE